MAVESVMLPLGTTAPPFFLPDVVNKQMYSLDSFHGKDALLVMFICQHCPYVKHVEQEIAKIGKDYQGKKLGIIAISSNDPVTYPDDAPDRLKEMAQRLDFRFPYCFDETQDVAKAYKAACTPDFYVFDAQRRLVYRGQLDDSRPGNNKPVTGRDLRAAIDAVLAGKPVDPNQRPSIGCSIKWKQYMHSSAAVSAVR
ncbi:MAG TPA: thioredoxin family protein [Nitrospira sp.]|nr:thioredoxin family protein [Nitrospira sp.]